MTVFMNAVVYFFVFFAIIFFGILFFNELILFIFLFMDYSIKSIYNPQEYKPASIWLYSKNFWLELYYVVSKYLYLPLKAYNFTMKGSGNTDTAILLIHGYCRNQTDWLWMHKQFKKSGCAVFCVNLSPRFAAIEEISNNSLPQKIAEMKQKVQCKNLILIGHSMGGLVASHYSAYQDHENLVKAVITIASPFYGTKVSIVGKGHNAKQMCPGSKFLEELRAKLQISPHKHYQICSKFDNMIFPWQSALLEETPSSQKHVFPFASHLSLLHSKAVATQLDNWVFDLISQKHAQY